MSSVPRDPYLVYLDANVLVDMADSRSIRRASAQRLLQLFQNRSNNLHIYTSRWAIAEAHGVLYGKKLEDIGIVIPLPRGRVRGNRNVFPPRSTELLSAKSDLDNLLSVFSTTTRNFTILPGDLSTFQLVIRIGEETAVWPADSIHLAFALQSGCSMIVATDNDLLNKIDYYRTSFIVPIRQAVFSQIFATLPPFQCHGLVQTRRNRGTTLPRQRLSAYDELTNMGFTP